MWFELLVFSEMSGSNYSNYSLQIDLIHSAYVVHTLYQQQKLGKYCDLKVLVGDKQYFVHRCILAAASAQLDSQINVCCFKLFK